MTPVDTGAGGSAADLVLRDVEVAYRVRNPAGFGHSLFPAVKRVSFDVPAGEIVGLVGESGSGKSSIGRAILGLVDVAGGSIAYGDSVLSEQPKPFRLEIRRLIQAVPQDPWSSLNPRRQIGTVLADVLLRHQRCQRSEVRQRSAELLDLVGLAPSFAHRFPAELSGGQRQRVSIARALAVEPRVIVCDEIVSALDVSTQSHVLDLLTRLRRETGVSMLFISHDLAVVRAISQRIAVMQSGELREWGSTDQVFGAPSSDYTRALLDAIPGRTASELQQPGHRHPATTSRGA
jgi:peptide/nickel transport system ATP-binding protein